MICTSAAWFGTWVQVYTKTLENIFFVLTGLKQGEKGKRCWITVRWTVRSAERLCPQAKESLRPCQKIRQVSTCRIFLSIAKAMAYHHALACISSPKVYIISRRLYPLSQWWYTRLLPWRYTKLRFDDMHACGVIWYVSSSLYENSWKYLFYRPFTKKKE